MRRGLALLICMLLFTVWNVSAQIEEPRYIIYFDSNNKSDLEIKKKVIETYDDLMEQVDEISHMSFLAEQTELFEFDNTMKAFFLNGTLKIVIGDGQGLVLEGTFIKESCDIEINKRSWLLELLS